MLNYTFDTEIGKMTISWEKDKIQLISLPERGMRNSKSKPPKWVKESAQQIQKHLQGKYCDFENIPLDFSSFTEFQKLVYDGCQNIAVGSTMSYGELAEIIGRPRAARAVGTALGKNLFPIVIPCHRVLASGRKIGGFSAEGTISTKYRILEIEKAKVNNVPSKIPEWLNAMEILANKDKKLGKSMRKIGTFHLEKSSAHSIFESLAMSIVFQQLAGAAARAIWQRFCQLFPREIPTAKKLIRISDEVLRSVGLSRNKMLAIRDLAQKTSNKEITTDIKQLANMSDKEIIKDLTQVRGIGNWTVQMLLMFFLQRLDVFPEDDYGISKGFAVLYELKNLPKPKEMREAAKKWQPYRTIASWYLWRLADLEKEKT
ncbi:methylated-DNA--[protein]-cysteine S-methyltransferase [Candidatus Uabimicrobium sp. HlEnr_7]|uniref:methylated-DNA--[protein]-cysteine S-methyltransferase n=1 Tax=Candidatus Uabimicrobium helgolandensis TaxID=3095367 RepID=UPI0035574CEC